MTWLWLLAFLLTLAECAVGTLYNQCVRDRRPLAAASWGALFEALLLVDMLFMFSDWRLAFPIISGAFLGIYWTVKK